VNTKPALRLAESKPDRSPERAALAQAIEDAQTLLAEINATDGAVRYAKLEVSRAKSNVAKFEQQLADAKTDQAQILVARALGDQNRTVQKTAQEARRDLENSKDDLEAMEEAQASLEEKLKDLQGQYQSAEAKVKARVHEVIATDEATIAFVRRFAETERAYLESLSFIDHCPLLHPKNIHAHIGDRRFDPATAIASWRDWEARLREDPDATRHS
jgi:chromosome segregation ATPase